MTDLTRMVGPEAHGTVDYLAAGAAALAPMALQLDSPAKEASYAVVGLSLGVAGLTRAPFGLLKVLPYRVHGGIEIVSALGMLAAPWLLGFSDKAKDRNYFLAMGGLVLVSWLTTDWSAEDDE